MTPWMLRVVWPVEDPLAGYTDAVTFAAQDLQGIAEARDVLLFGEPAWEMVEHDDRSTWPYTDLALVALVPAMPAHPTRPQWPVVVRYLAGEGWGDRDIAKKFGISRDSVIHVRRKYGIAAGKPPGGQRVEEAA